MCAKPSGALPARARRSRRKRRFRVRLGRYTALKELTSNDDTLCLKRRPESRCDVACDKTPFQSGVVW